MPLMIDKHFTRKSNLVFPSFVLISNQSNANEPHLTCSSSTEVILYLVSDLKGCHTSEQETV